MKQFFFIALATASALGLSAQGLTVASIERVATPMEVDQAVISPDGLTAIVSSPKDLSLSSVDLQTGVAKKVVDSATIYALTFSDDSRSIAYIHETTDVDRRRYKEVRKLSLDNGEDVSLAAPSRRFNAVSLQSGRAEVITDAKATVTNFGSSTARRTADEKVKPVAFTYYGQLMVTDADGNTNALNPQGKEGMSYLWPTVSPDGTKVAYFLVASGAYVCDIDGSNSQYLGVLRAPAWLDNSTVVGMRDTDDGHVVTSSAIIARDLRGGEQVLTPDNIIAMYPTVSADGSRVAFTNAKGDLYLMKLTR